MHFMRAQTSKTSLPEGQTKNSLIAKELGHKSWVSQGTKSSGMGLWQSMVAWISGRLNHPRARPAVIKALEIEPPMNLSMKDGKTRRHGDQSHLRNCLPLERTTGGSYCGKQDHQGRSWGIREDQVPKGCYEKAMRETGSPPSSLVPALPPAPGH